MKKNWNLLQAVIHERIWAPDLDTLGRFRKTVISAIRLLHVIAKELAAGQLTLRAMSLVYTTLLSLVPLLAVSFSVLKAFGVHNQIEPFLLNFLAPLGQKGYEVTEKIIGFVENVKVGVLGSIGLGLLIYTVISLIQKVELSFNYVWKIKRSRSFVQKFSNYLSVIIVGPVLVFSAVGITASILNTTLVQKLVALEPFGSIIYTIGKFIPYLLVCAAFTFIYIFLPNTRVRFNAALTGGLVAGILWETTGWLFASFIVSSTKYTAIYSGFAILIMFMIWLYLSWLILLIGAVVSFYRQYPQYIAVQNDTFQLSSRLKERIALMVMYLIGYSYYHDKSSWTLEKLVQKMKIPIEPVRNILSVLEAKGLLLSTADDPPIYVPATDMDKIALVDIYSAVRTAEDSAYPINERSLSTPEIDKVIKDVDRTLSAQLGAVSLKGLVESGSPHGREKVNQ